MTTEFETYHHGGQGERKLISNYEGSIPTENPWLEDAFNDLLDEARDGRGEVDNQHVLALIIEEFGVEIIETAHEVEADEMLNTYIRAIEERRSDPEPTQILEKLRQKHEDKSAAELEAAKKAFEEELEGMDVSEEHSHEQAVNRGSE
jgi:hypothetical protein